MSTEAWIVVVVAGVLVLVTLVLAVRLLVRLVKARGLLREAGIPVQNKAVFWGAILYLVSPVDLLPDPVYLDDIGILLLALRSLYSAAEAAGLRPRRD
ncbi:YkvA family protein [Streptomyces sp. NPDC053560]|uniref:YkvA family protein n=1 Tax=Streptomyces sp. NPDC053560 TaxID=3365711 RepID=UPI0037D44A8A